MATETKSAAEVKGASVEAGRSVAEAVKKVADAAVAEIQKVGPAEQVDLVASGSPGGRVIILGRGFGPSGTVKLNGAQINTREWSTTRIVGDLPAEAKSGEIVVHVDDKVSRRGYITL